VAIAIAGAGLLVVQWAAARPLWLDEELLAINLRDRGIPTYFEPLWLGQFAPFGWLVLERLVVIAFGTSERALRCLPVLFGIATLATAVWIGRRWMTAAGAATLVILCAGSQWLTFYFLELKSYSADAFFALLLPAVAAWSVDEITVARPSHRPAIFWIMASIAQWFANGALFVTPLCALMLAAMLARRDGWRSALRFSCVGIVWLGSFALNGMFVLRHAQASAYLQSFWAFAFPPPSAGAVGTLQWVGTQLAAFGGKPGSTRFGVLLWIAAIAGFFVHGRFAAGAMTRRTVALFYATVPLSAVLLATLRLVPFYERLTLWMLPALYVGVALLADAAWIVLHPKPVGADPRVPPSLRYGEARQSAKRDGGRPGADTWVGPYGRPARAAAAIGLCVAIMICADVVIRGVPAALVRARARHENRGHDDRAAVRWLMSHKQPGDVWMTTHYGAPAIWWYAGIDDQRIVEVSHQPDGSECRHDELAAAVSDVPHVLLYLGFRFDDVPDGFDDLLVGRLSQLGSVTSYRPFADNGNAIIIDRRVAGAPTTLSRLDGRLTDAPPAIDRCFAPRVAEIPTFVR
jgi:hypothetical protein